MMDAQQQWELWSIPNNPLAAEAGAARGVIAPSHLVVRQLS